MHLNTEVNIHALMNPLSKHRLKAFLVGAAGEIRRHGNNEKALGCNKNTASAARAQRGECAGS